MLIRILAIFFITLSLQFVQAHQQCQKMIQAHSCKYYLCEEMNHTHGPNGYFIAFGYKFCANYIRAPKSYYRPQTVKWLSDVAICLQNKLRMNHAETDTEKQVWLKAVQTHAQCYYETGACDLPRTELLKVINQFKYELRYPAIFLEGMKFVSYCAHRREGNEQAN